TFYQELRRDILDGKPVNNKLHEGKVIEDTAQIDIMTAYHPTVSRPDFLLATKNTLAYMARLPQLKQVLPNAPIIACIRHPLDTIASWKTSFPHLKQAQVVDFSVGSLNDPFLSGSQRHQLAEIILTNAHQLIIVRYEDLVTQPVKVLKTILASIPHAPNLPRRNQISASTVRQKREVLDDDDLQAVNDICRESAIALGLYYRFSGK
ncbi:MAG TPA: sulfotransferase, partial [Beggiatoa sp.]|nr:sulfotransferase [Beggiatoa sp.]